MKAIENLRTFMKEPLSLIAELQREGDVVRCRLGPKPFVFIFDPDLAHHVLVTKAQAYPQSRMVFDRITPVTGRKGLVQLSGEESKRARTQARPLFSKPSLDEIRTIIETLTDRLLEDLTAQHSRAESGTVEIDISSAMNQLILKTALKIFMDIDSEELVRELGYRFQRLNDLCGQRMRSLFPLPLALPTRENLEIRNLYREIREKIAAHLASKPTLRSNGLASVFKDDPHLLDQCMTFVFAGHETTASSLAFTFLLLGQHSQYQTQIRTNPESTLTAYKESLRLYSPAYMLARESRVDEELGGVRVRKSDQVIIGLTAIHRDPRLFERPDHFVPERFNAPLSHRFSFLPFGAGPKSCVGERLAYLEASVVIPKFIERFSLQTLASNIQADPFITLNARPNQNVRLLPRIEKEKPYVTHA